MKNEKNRRASDLRKKVEEKLESQKQPKKAVRVGSKEYKEWIHELQVHQIELEMQNEELREMQIELEQSRAKYADLYDFAPVGYMTLDNNGIVLESNLTAITMLDADRQLIVRHPLASYILSEDRDILRKYLFDIFNTGEKSSCEVRLTRKKGPEMHVYLEGIVTHDSDNEDLCRISVLDITERKKAEELIKSSLREKETLIREVHHRVKNNMNFILSLLSLKSGSIDDALTQQIFDDMIARIKSMSFIHEKLYQSKTLGYVDFSEFLNQLYKNVVSVYSKTPEKIYMKIDSREVKLDVERAVPLSIVINELITNSLKYAFPSGYTDQCIITISAKNKKNNMVELVVRDNGVGMPVAFDCNKIESLGLKLVNSLVKDQLHGSIAINGATGTEFVINFPVEG